MTIADAIELRAGRCPVRHTQLSTTQMAALLCCDAAALPPQLADLCARRRLRERRDEYGRTYTLPSTLVGRTAAQTLREPKGTRTWRPLGLPRPAGKSDAARAAAHTAKIDRAVAYVAAHGRACGSDVAHELGCSYSTAWTVLGHAEAAGRLTSAMERSTPRGPVRRYFRVVGEREQGAAE